jgi:hypothetical protein
MDMALQFASRQLSAEHATILAGRAHCGHCRETFLFVIAIKLHRYSGSPIAWSASLREAASAGAQ